MTIFNSHDTAGTGNTDYIAMLKQLQGDMNERRHYAVQQTFLALPKNDEGNVSAEDIQVY